MNMKLYKTHELFHKHSYKKIGNANDNSFSYNIYKCECGLFVENHDKNGRFHNLYDGTLEWYEELAKLLIKTNNVKEVFEYINICSNDYAKINYGKLKNAIKQIKENT